MDFKKLKENITGIQLIATTIVILASIIYTSYNFTTGFFLTRADANEMVRQFEIRMSKANYERLLNKQFALDLQTYQMEKNGDSKSTNPTIKRIFNNILKQKTIVDNKIVDIESNKMDIFAPVLPLLPDVNSPKPIASDPDK